MPPFRVALADRQILFLQSIRKNLEGIPGLQVIGEVCSSTELLELLKKSPADMVILDVSHLHQIETVTQIKRTYPEVKILVLTAERTKEFLLQAILAKAEGYMLKENTYSDLITAMEKIRRGGTYFCEIISHIMAEIIRNELSSKIVGKSLSPRQIKVLTFLCESKSTREIADLLSLKPNTVRNYVVNIKKKLNLKTQLDLIKYAIKQGYVQG